MYSKHRTETEKKPKILMLLYNVPYIAAGKIGCMQILMNEIQTAISKLLTKCHWWAIH